MFAQDRFPRLYFVPSQDEFLWTDDAESRQNVTNSTGTGL